MAAGRHGCAEQVLGEDGELQRAQRHNSRQMPLLWVLFLSPGVITILIY